MAVALGVDSKKKSWTETSVLFFWGGRGRYLLDFNLQKWNYSCNSSENDEDLDLVDFVIYMHVLFDILDFSFLIMNVINWVIWIIF